MKHLYKLGSGVLLAVMVGTIVLLAFTLFPSKDNFQVKIVQSGSMEPDIKVGSIIVLKPSSSYAVGDVITFGKDTKRDVPTTHRIIETRIESGQTLFTTKGDANEDPDPREIAEEEVIGKVLFDVPYMGFLIDFARQPLGFALIIILPALIIAGEEFLKIIREIKRIRKEKEMKNAVFNQQQKG